LIHCFSSKNTPVLLSCHDLKTFHLAVYSLQLSELFGILGQLTQTMETNDVSSSEVYYNMSKPGVPSMEINDVSTTLAYINDVSTQNDIYKSSVQSSIPNNQVSSSLRIYDMCHY
jgi:hypothetical protein